MRQIVRYPMLRGAMAACGITVDMLARQLQKSTSTVFAKLNGRIAFDLAEAISIRNAFFETVTIDELFAEYHSPHAKSPIEKSEVC